MYVYVCVCGVETIETTDFVTPKLNKTNIK
jgi:hypothetical protein